MSLFTESSIASMEMKWRQGISGLENPDKVISVKGMEYIEDIERDTKYSSCLNTRIQAVIGKGWKIKPHITNSQGKEIITERDQMISDFLRDQLKIIPVFETDIIAFFDHISKGFSLSEINYKKITRGKWKGKIGLKDIRKKEAKLFSFEFDKFGHYKPVQVDPERTVLDPFKFIHFINGLNDENPYGESIGSKVAFWVWVKKNGVKFWSIYIERFGMPMGRVKMPNNVKPGSAEDQKADDLLDMFQTATGIKVPKDLEADFLEAVRSGDGSYENFRKACNDEIATIVLGQPLSTGEGTKGSGTHALGSVHAGVLNAYTLFDVIISSAAINNQLIRRLVDLNFDTEYYPVFEWNSFNMSILVALSQNLRYLVESGLRIPAKDIYDKIGLRVPEKNEEILKVIDAISNIPNPKGSDNKIIQNRELFQEDPGIKSLIKQNNKFVKENDYIVNLYIKKLALIYSDLKEEIKKLKNFNGKTQARLKKSFEKQILTDIYEFLVLGSISGKNHAQKQLSLKRSYAEGTDTIPGDYSDFKTMIGGLIAKEVLTRKEFDILSQIMKRKAFTIAGVQSEMLLTEIKEAFARTLESGGDWEILKSEIDSLFNKFGVTKLKNYHLENVVRTNLQTVYSEAREKVFSLVDFDEFSSKMVMCVLDERTRPDHAKLHLFTRSSDDPIWNILKTPFDYNCRCTIIMVHKSMKSKISNTMPDLRNLRFI